MSRSKWKSSFLDKIFLKTFIVKKPWFEVWSRRSVITSNLVGKKIYIHNGQIFKSIIVTREKVGFKVGEFSLTHQPYGKKTKLKKK
jgi:ribosomal protein S19